MNETQISRALSQGNTAQISEATRIPPYILDRIADGHQVPTPVEIDALVGWFKGEYSLSGTSFNWERRTRTVETLPLPLGAPFLPGPEYPFPNDPILKAGPANVQKHAVNSEAYTGSGVRVK